MQSSTALEFAPMQLDPLGKRPLVSVLMSNYNYAAYLAEAITSVLTQTYSHFELVVCDDGSTDNSVEIARKFEARDSRVRVLVKSNGGQATGFNASFSKCSGEIICLLDSDDVYRPEKLARIVAKFRSASGAGCVLHRVLRVDGARRPRGPLPLFAQLPTGWFGPRILRTGGILSDLPGSMGLNVRREVALRMFPMPEDPPLTMCPDQVIQRLVPLLTRLEAIPDCLVEYRVHSRNTYIQRTVTAQSITRELDLTEHLWRYQRHFLERMYPDAVPALAPVSADRGVKLQRYVRARMLGDPASAELYREFMAGVMCVQRPMAHGFWKTTRYMPRAVFGYAANLYLAQGRAKQIAGMIAAVCRRKGRRGVLPSAEAAL